jgi:transposase-like protein
VGHRRETSAGFTRRDHDDPRIFDPSHLAEVTRMLTPQFPKVSMLSDAARRSVRFRRLPRRHWRTVWSANPLEGLNGEIKRQTGVVASSPTTPRCAGT